MLQGEKETCGTYRYFIFNPLGDTGVVGVGGDEDDEYSLCLLHATSEIFCFEM